MEIQSEEVEKIIIMKASIENNGIVIEANINDKTINYSQYILYELMKIGINGTQNIKYSAMGNPWEYCSITKIIADLVKYRELSGEVNALLKKGVTDGTN